MPPEATSPRRLPPGLSVMLAKARDPQQAFSQDFGGAGAVAPAPAAATAPDATPAEKPPASTEDRQPAKRRRTDPDTAGKGGALTKKTYRLRPDQYVKLALLEARLLEKHGEKIGGSELAREAFDLLFKKYGELLAS